MIHHRTTAPTSDAAASRERPLGAFDSIRFHSIPFDSVRSVRVGRRARPRPRPRRRGPLTRVDPQPSRLDARCQRTHAHTTSRAPFSHRHRRRAFPAARSARAFAPAPRRPKPSSHLISSHPHDHRIRRRVRRARRRPRVRFVDARTRDTGRRRRGRRGSTRTTRPTRSRRHRIDHGRAHARERDRRCGARAAARGVGADGADDGDDSRVSSGSTLARSAPGERVAAGDRRRARVGRDDGVFSGTDAIDEEGDARVR